MSSRKFLVTGAGGYVGSHLVGALVARDAKVVALDDLSNCGSWHRLCKFQQQVEFVQGDVLDPTVAERSIREVDTVFHCAELAEHSCDPHPALEYQAVNAGATIQLLEAARLAGTRRVIFISTSAVYGQCDDRPLDERSRPAPRNSYAASKLAAEHFVSVYAGQYGLETINLRLANVFGDGGDHMADVAATLATIGRAIHTAPAAWNVHPNAVFDLCHVEDVASAALLAADAPRLSGEVVNIGSGSSVTSTDIAAAARHLAGVGANGSADSPRTMRLHAGCLDITAAQALLAFKPKVRFSDVISVIRHRIARDLQKLN